MTLDPEQLLLKINTGKKVPDADLFEVVSLLQAVQLPLDRGRAISFDELYPLLLVVGRAKLTKARPIVERFIDCQDPETASLAFEILCRDWGLSEEYLEQLLSSALGVSWDHEGDLQRTAITLLGEFLRSQFGDRRSKSKGTNPRNTNALALLFNVFEDTTADYHTRLRAYFALCRVGGKNWEEIPSEFARLNLLSNSKDIDWHLLNAIRRFCSSPSVGNSAL